MAPSSPRRAHARARRAYGQNFLSSSAALRTVVDAACLKPDDLVYEVGAGRGRLTSLLLARAGRVVAFEVDPAHAAALPAHPRLEVRVADFLRASPPPAPFAVVGNIPYALTAPVVRWCLDAPSLLEATLVTQLEYARKRTGDYGRWSRLTIETWPTHEWELAGRIPRTAFRPVPRVDGGVLRLAHRDIPLVAPADLAAYRSFVDCGFTGVGGSLAASLSRRYGRRRVASAFRANRLSEDVPVGMVWPENWLTLFRLIA
ncbi:ErmE/ErmH/ErmO/ErmR family 23S rRNA (adenine(2058)-N(6))-methyltransferase [Actinoplanes sp. NPDC051633]|uniref:ErmE/ErmH/ErmO/ErmR family 23S rRNA (adenine(2058)-N(6))-methyltransferase n=1 Tax=Actinoplanes sp. NPDC051633 TaxID=3155670 RepID=UPI003424E490